MLNDNHTGMVWYAQVMKGNLGKDSLSKILMTEND
jgi:hypothetical protein